MLTGAIIKAEQEKWKLEEKKKRKGTLKKKKIHKRGEQHFTGECTRVERESKCWELSRAGREIGDATK